MSGQYTAFGFVLRDHAAVKSSSGITLDCKIVFGAENVPADEIDAQRDLESLIVSGQIRTFGEILHVTSWNYSFPKQTENQPDACLITFNYQSVTNPLRESERLERVEKFLNRFDSNSSHS
jgi:hypothetical protein